MIFSMKLQGLLLVFVVHVAYPLPLKCVSPLVPWGHLVFANEHEPTILFKRFKLAATFHIFRCAELKLLSIKKFKNPPLPHRKEAMATIPSLELHISEPLVVSCSLFYFIFSKTVTRKFWTHVGKLAARTSGTTLEKLDVLILAIILFFF